METIQEVIKLNEHSHKSSEIKLIDIDIYLKILGHKGRAMYLRKNLEAI